jgi:hypothetical protein
MEERDRPDRLSAGAAAGGGVGGLQGNSLKIQEIEGQPCLSAQGTDPGNGQSPARLFNQAGLR